MRYPVLFFLAAAATGCEYLSLKGDRLSECDQEVALTQGRTTWSGMCWSRRVSVTAAADPYGTVELQVETMDLGAFEGDDGCDADGVCAYEISPTPTCLDESGSVRVDLRYSELASEVELTFPLEQGQPYGQVKIRIPDGDYACVDFLPLAADAGVEAMDTNDTGS